MKNIDEIRGDKASSEAPEEKNPYQQILDLPDNEFMDFIEGMEMVKEAILWLFRHPEEAEKLERARQIKRRQKCLHKYRKNKMSSRTPRSLP